MTMVGSGGIYIGLEERKAERVGQSDWPTLSAFPHPDRRETSNLAGL
jgi:hypothetical protein